MSRLFKLTGEGKKAAKVPSTVRCEVLDFLYQHKTGTMDELTAVDPEARDKVRAYQSKGWVLEIA